MKNSISTVLGTLVVLAGCGSNSETRDQSDLNAYIATSQKWPTNQISTCWETTGFTTEKGWVRHRIVEEINNKTKISFNGWTDCLPGSRGVRIKIEDTAAGPHVKSLGRSLDGITSGMSLNFSFLNWSENCSRENRQRSCIESIGVHEFGHALGLAHEQNRSDTPSVCKDAPQGTDGDLMVGGWDFSSVMNYCNDDYNNGGRLSRGDIYGLQALYGVGGSDHEYFSGHWAGNKASTFAVRRGQCFLINHELDGNHNRMQCYGDSTDTAYLVGDWDGRGGSNIAVRRGNKILMDTNYDGMSDITLNYGNGDAESEYLVGDWDGDGRDNIAVRRGSRILMDTNFDGEFDLVQNFGEGNSESQYLVGDWDGDGRDNIAVRRGNRILMDFNFDGITDREQVYGNGDAEEQYLVGDWDGDGKDNIAVRRGNRILMDINYDGIMDWETSYGNGTH